jgi:hypothetical protein
MKTLIIKDLARTEQLDRSAMAAVHGGWKMPAPSYTFGTLNYSPTSDSSIHTSQDLGQVQNVLNETADGSAFLKNVTTTNTTKQFGQNNVTIG